jgi:hypothetical protein
MFSYFSQRKITSTPRSVCTTPIFVDRYKRKAVLVSLDYCNAYSAAYAGLSDGKPNENLVKELFEETAGFFDHPSPQNQQNTIRSNVAQELQELQKEMIRSTPADYHHLKVGDSSAVITWVSEDEKQVGAIIFLPVETLGVEEIDQENETEIPTLTEQLNYAHKAGLSGCYKERKGFRLVDLGRFISETKPHPTQKDRLIPKERLFDGKLHPVRFNGNHLAWPETIIILTTVFEEDFQPYQPRSNGLESGK